MVQSLIPAIYPILKNSFHLSFAQVGLITLTYQMTASVLQPAVGLYTDRRHQPYSLAVGMGFTLIGLVLLSIAVSFASSCSLPRWSGWAQRFSSRVFAGSADGLGGERIGAVCFSGRRECGLRHRTVARGVYRCSAWAAQHRMVYFRCFARHGGVDTCWRLVRGAHG